MANLGSPISELTMFQKERTEKIEITNEIIQKFY